jgi:hypothetical protein
MYDIGPNWGVLSETDMIAWDEPSEYDKEHVWDEYDEITLRFDEWVEWGNSDV